MGIDDHGDLPGLGEEVPVDEHVVGRQEDAELGMRVLPTEDQLRPVYGF